jgi:hypothetical protein
LQIKAYLGHSSALAVFSQAVRFENKTVNQSKILREENVKLVFIAIVRCLGTLLIMGVLVFQPACAPTHTALTVTSPRGEAGASSIETASPPTMSVATAITSQEVERPSAGNPKLGSSMNLLLEAYQRGGLADAQAFAEMNRMTLDDGRVQVEIVVVREALSDVRKTVEVMGGEYQSHYETLLQALVPLNALELLAQRPDVQVIREPRRAGP